MKNNKTLIERAQTKRNLFVVEEEQTAISFLKKILPQTPLSLIYKLFRSKKIKLEDDYLRYYQHRLKAGQKLLIEDEKILKIQNSVTPKKRKIFQPGINFEIIYEDDNILIALKDHGIETHNEESPEKSLDNAVAHYLNNSGWGNQSSTFVITSSHRIDKVTKGLVIYPKNPDSKKILHKALGNKDIIKKKYIAVCENKKNKQAPDKVNGFITKDDKKEKMIFSIELPDSNQIVKKCSMNISQLCSKDKFTALEIDLETGRKHQIRAILSHINLPIIGDKKYNSNFELGNKIKLFAYKIEIVNLPKKLSYLNGKSFEIKNIKERIVKQIKSIEEGLLPKKFLKE